MWEILFAIILVLTAILAVTNVYQSYRNFQVLKSGETYLTKKLRNANLAFLWLEIGTVLLLGTLFSELIFLRVEQPDSILAILFLIVLFKAIIKAGVYRENLLFKKQLENLIEFNLEEGKEK